MYSKEEAKEVRLRYWNKFKSWSGRQRVKKGMDGKWLMNNTGIKQLKLKFHFDEKTAIVAIEIDTKNLEKRFTLWDKLESLKKIITTTAPFSIKWDIEYQTDFTKNVSRVYSILEDVNIYNPECWKEVNTFFFERMLFFEEFFLEYKDYLKHG